MDNVYVRFGGGSEEKCQVSPGYLVTRLFPTLLFLFAGAPSRREKSRGMPRLFQYSSEMSSHETAVWCECSASRPLIALA
jgi:hypothetical protein